MSCSGANAISTDAAWVNPYIPILHLCASYSRTRVLFGHKLRSPDLNEPFFEHLRKNFFTIQKVTRELLDPNYLNAKSDVYVLQLQEAVHIPSC